MICMYIYIISIQYTVYPLCLPILKLSLYNIWIHIDYDIPLYSH